ncbi:proline dehydrogenase [Cohnella pontilimi]|uniref:proline dehydrogenase n=1 Tax=Cohnella pontilimi TaxID=2564100 RepID=A0A4U0FHG0_9BACL|nr:proline dehydrogenase [Cohnella pontilimi]TJY42862.1 proline dehydrogenase [Cohnella pontilimi]
METILRNTFQFLGKNRTVQRMARRYGLKFGASRFVAGETIEQAIRTVRKLNEEGMMATLDHLGEFVGTEEEAVESAAMCVRTLEAIASSGVNSNLSLKMTSLGLDISKELCLRNMRNILDTARRYGNFVRIDMEDFAHCQVTLDILQQLRAEYDNVGTVIQAYLYRSEQDIHDLNRLKPNLRLVKGAYKESPQIAFPEKSKVDENFKKIIKLNLTYGNYTAIASHDAAIIADIKAFIQERGLPRDAYEFQMLFGISEDLQRQLVNEGYRVRIYVPYGVDWFGYFMRRLAERPANVWFVLKNLFK